MADSAIKLNDPSALDMWRLRLAQQAFSALLEEAGRCGRISATALRSNARGCLSRLSVDDRGRLDHWLALQLATISAVSASNGLGALATVDPGLASSVRSRAAQIQSALATLHHWGTVAA
ncbi:MAG TPA: hypothetical protein VFN25_15455 [Dokdonella sp.]|nr:hypothetical protein [Dokdonella sp.]